MNAVVAVVAAAVLCAVMAPRGAEAVKGVDVSAATYENAWSVRLLALSGLVFVRVCACACACARVRVCVLFQKKKKN